MTDDRIALQSQIDSGAGGIVELPPGRFVIGQGDGFYGLTIPAGTTLRGAGPGTILVMAPGTAPSVRLIEISGPGVTLADLTLEGGRTSQADLDEHRAGVFCRAPGARLERVVARGFTGDGFYFYSGSDGFHVEQCEATGNGRNGLTLGSGMTGGTIQDSRFTGNGAQQFDSEPGGPVSDIEVRRCLMDGAGASSDYALTVTGGSPLAMSAGWRIDDCDLRGGLHVVWARDVRISDCRIVNPTSKPCLSVYRTCEDVAVVDSELRSTGEAMSVVDVTGTGEGGPSRVVVRRCDLRGGQSGVMAQGSISVEVYDSEIRSDSFGVYARATVIGRPFEDLVIRGNRVTSRVGVKLAGNGDALFRRVDISGNTFLCSKGALDLNDGSGAARDVCQTGNAVIGDVRAVMLAAPGGLFMPWDSGGRWVLG